MATGSFPKTFEIFRLVQTVSKYLALPTFRVIYSNPVWLKLYGATVEIINLSLAARMLLRFWLEPFSAAAFIETACTVGYVLVENIRFFILYKKRKVIDNYLIKIEKINYVTVRKTDEFLKIFERNDRFKQKFERIMFSYQTAMAIAVFLLGPFVLPPEYVKIPALYPWKNLHPSMEYVYMALDFLVALYLPARNIAVDFTCLTFLTFHVSQLEYLKLELKKILSDMENGEKRRKELSEWYRSHQESLSLINNLRSFLEPIILINYANSLVCAVTAIFFVIEKSSMQMTQKVVAFCNIFAFFFFLGWFCNYVDQVNHQHEAIPNQFDLHYAAQNKRLKNDFLILAPRCSRKIKISAMGFFTLSSKGFSDIISTSLSVLATFWQIRKRALS